MCLSTVYRDKAEASSVLMKNVMKIECRAGQVVLTDLLQRQVTFDGELVEADLVGGVAIVKEH